MKNTDSTIKEYNNYCYREKLAGRIPKSKESYDQERIREIDEVMTEVGGFKMGPFTLMDLIGIDINYDVTCSVWKSYYNDPRFRPHRIQKEMVDSGRIGKKAGKGFYSYDK